MAQWAGGYSGNTHATRVDDAEAALKQAITTIRDRSADEPMAQDFAKVTRMAERLLSARVRMLKARLTALQDASAQEGASAGAQLSDLRDRLTTVQAQGVAGILAGFGMTT
jgi:hypothetical protein